MEIIRVGNVGKIGNIVHVYCSMSNPRLEEAIYIVIDTVAEHAVTE